MDLRRPRFVLAFFSAASALFGVFVLTLFLSGGVDAAPPTAAAAPARAPTRATQTRTPARERPTVAVRASDYGPILFDGRGRALYAFTRDPVGESVCAGDCAAAWPPYLAGGRMRAGNGARQRLLGTVKRQDGALQVAYGGRPLYYYVGDRQPGQVLCQNVVEFGGTWLVVRGSGRLVQ